MFPENVRKPEFFNENRNGKLTKNGLIQSLKRINKILLFPHILRISLFPDSWLYLPL